MLSLLIAEEPAPALTPAQEAERLVELARTEPGADAGAAVTVASALASPARYVVHEVTSQVRRVRNPYRVIDTRTNAEIDEYKSKRAAASHARELNRAAAAAARPQGRRTK